MPRSLSSSSLPSVLIIGEDAGDYAALVETVDDLSIRIAVCPNASEAASVYSDQTILFGDPESIASVLPDMPTVEWVQSTWAGVTPLLEIDRRDYLLTGIKGVFGPQMSEYVIGYMLANELKVIERLAAQRDHQWFEKASGTLLAKKIGVMGTGSIGQAIARRAKDNGMTVTGLSCPLVRTSSMSVVPTSSTMRRWYRPWPVMSWEGRCLMCLMSSRCLQAARCGMRPTC